MTTDASSVPASNGRHPLARFEQFMVTVRKACSRPAGRAILRQGLEESHPSWQVYEALLEAGGIPAPRDRAAEKPFLLVAALYALHDAPNPRMTASQPARKAPQPARLGHNLGWSYQRAVAAKAMRRKVARDDLAFLAQLDAEGLLRELPPAVSLLRSRRVPVRWPVLLRDLTRWPSWADDVRIDWVRAFHTPSAVTPQENPE